jgi:hypothetical protein
MKQTLKIKTGVSLDWDYLLGNPERRLSMIWEEIAGHAKRLLPLLREEDVASVEIRGFNPATSPDTVTGCLETLAAYDLGATLHGYMPETWSPGIFSSVYPWISAWPRHLKLIFVIHACSSRDPDISLEVLSHQTTECLLGLDQGMREAGVNCQLALELNRKRQVIDPGSDPEGLLAMLAPIAPPVAGICWDMGHGYANELLGLNSPESTADPGFSSRVVHTHIHALARLNSKTHDFLSQGDLPFDRYARSLWAADYQGIWNLEIKPDPTLGRGDALSHLLEDVRIMQTTLGALPSD